MSTEPLLLLRALILVSLALALVLALRKPVLRLIGARTSLYLWLLLPTLALLPWLPVAPVASLIVMQQLPTILLSPSAIQSVALSPTPWVYWIVLLWLIGSITALLYLKARHQRLRQQVETMSTAEIRQWSRRLQRLAQGKLPRIAWHPQGPAILIGLPNQLLLPHNLTHQHSNAVIDLILRHELTHHARHDPLWLLLGELSACLLWFHPLVWIALPRLQLDLELACDATVLEATPTHRVDYARTLLHSAHIVPQWSLIPWHSTPHLKERLIMLKQRRIHPLIRRISQATLALGLTSVITIAWAVQQPSVVPEPNTSAPTTIYTGLNSSPPPRSLYPIEAIRNGKQGTVILNVLVGTDGIPRQIKILNNQKIDPQLTAAAAAAVWKYRFNPGTRDGQAIASWVKVPVTYKLNKHITDKTPTRQQTSRNPNTDKSRRGQ